MTPSPLVQVHIPALAAALAAMEPWSRLGYSAAGLAGYLGRDDPALRRVAVIGADGMPAAVLALRHPWLRGPSIELLAVLPQARGQGLGRTLLDWASTQAGDGNLWACVSAFNGTARTFYARHGFVEVAPLPDLVAVGESEILLRRPAACGACPSAAR